MMNDKTLTANQNQSFFKELSEHLQICDTLLNHIVRSCEFYELSL